MRILIVSAVAGAAVALASAAQGAEAPIASIETEYLGRLKVTTDPAQLIAPCIVYPVTNCAFRGPKINATCVARLIVTPDGPSRLEIRATLKTDEGEVIFMDEGIIVLGKDAVDLTHPLIYASPKVSVKTLFWRSNSSYLATSGRSLCSGMLGMRP